VRYGVDGSFTVMARNTAGLEVGQRVPPEDQSVAATVFRTRRAARLDLAWDAAETDSVVRWAPEVRSIVSAPIVVQARLWGAMIAAWTGPTPPTADAEDRLCEFTELTASAIANADSRAELAASRARAVAAGDESRRRIERDLHDGIQQQLVSLGLELRLTEAEVRPDHDLKAGLAKLAHMLAGTIEDLRELSRGIHPTVLSNGGLGPGLRSLAHRSAVPVQLEVGVEGRLQEPIEVAAYYVVSEALTTPPSTPGRPWCGSASRPTTGSCGSPSVTTASAEPTQAGAQDSLVSATASRPLVAPSTSPVRPGAGRPTPPRSRSTALPVRRPAADTAGRASSAAKRRCRTRTGSQRPRPATPATAHSRDPGLPQALPARGLPRDVVQLSTVKRADNWTTLRTDQSAGASHFA